MGGFILLVSILKKQTGKKKSEKEAFLRHATHYLPAAMFVAEYIVLWQNEKQICKLKETSHLLPLTPFFFFFSFAA